jgi:hypothetical protein
MTAYYASFFFDLLNYTIAVEQLTNYALRNIMYMEGTR